MTPEEINEAVARKLGWRIHVLSVRSISHSHGTFLERKVCWSSPDDPTVCGGKIPPDYCNDIAAAWKVLEKMIGDPDPKCELIWNGTEWNIWIGVNDGSFHKSISRAICLAFLKLK